MTTSFTSVSSALRTFANEQLVSQFLTFYHNPEIDPHTLVEPFLWIKNLWMPDSPFATYMPDVQSLRLVDYKVWNDVSAKLVADGVRARTSTPTAFNVSTRVSAESPMANGVRNTAPAETRMALR